MCIRFLLTVQLHEWCQFMVGSGKITVPDLERSVRSSKTSTLADEEVGMLEDAYCKLIPQFDTLRNEYNKAVLRAVNARQKSTFPPRRDWIPPPPLQSKRSTELFHGPSGSVMLLDHVPYYDFHKRHIKLSSSEGESKQSTHQSFVHLINDKSLARITRLFSHEFVDQSSSFALVYIFLDPCLDPESNLYFVNPMSFSQKVVSIHELSPPHVVAYEGDNLWYLSYRVV